MLTKKIQEFKGKSATASSSKQKQIQLRPGYVEDEEAGKLPGTYYGPLANSVRQGEGLFVWDDGFLVQGTWQNNKLNGVCKILFTKSELPPAVDVADTTILAYNGPIKDDKLDGTGTLIQYEQV